MGIEGFWQIASKAAQPMSFKYLNAELMNRNVGNPKPMVVGVDACLWLTQCQAVFHKPHHAQLGRNPELRALFHKLAALNDAGVTAVFVFDGSNRPSVKRNKNVRSQPHWLVKEFQEMIALYGFYTHTAPGEAEAELALLNRLQHIDAVLTDDGDAAVFGASRIIRTLNKKNKDEITVYTSENLQSNSHVGLTTGGILLLAILAGGDYDTAGLPNCGFNIAHALARGGYGDSLLNAVQNLDEHHLYKFLGHWREQLREELRTNSQGYLKNKQKILSTKIPDTFPSIRVLRLYAQPITSWSEGFTAPNVNHWVVKLPSLPELALFCKTKFGWTPIDIAGKFKRFIFPGVCVRRLTLPFNLDEHLRDHVVFGRVQDEHPPLSAFLSIIAHDEDAARYKMKINIGGLSVWTLMRLDAPASAAGSAGACIECWMPACLIQHYFPSMVGRLHSAQSSAPTTMPADCFATPCDPGQKTWLGFIDLTKDDIE
ncbi:PIN domain-like protein [Mycena pura]|uniref:PIN domain-like protein n=1 Tax=Mycena pura TaxID=153505 RepID=A0AAD6VBT0_9AGAR|nr:PIN domain-like protein [Mycena pura]